MNSRSGSFDKQRIQSFVDRGAGATTNLRSMNQSSTYSKWGSPDGKLEGFNYEGAKRESEIERDKMGRCSPETKWLLVSEMVAGDGDLDLFLVSDMVVGDGDLDLFLMLGGLIWIF
ncbi:hypothetical protein L6452_15476 [Arctium lappa]|uniref:Uncharacterized protein n=1 Tax=Arctium lappa TaxID=4217 RepID=A0ACB9CNU0_ARCLA|nr:hypothetical protein L6452_15476 [Arctium lappa]